MLVFVLNKRSKPLMPCTPAKARRLLINNLAKVISKKPFTIKLLFGSSEQKQKIIAGMDTGSKTIGIAAIANRKVLYQAKTKLRGEEIKKKMTQRKMYRRTRRSRKLRLRKSRFLNRKASIKLSRLPPSVRHKVETHLREKKFLESILPISKWIVETASFDIHKITNPNEVSKALGKGHTYQKGRLLDFYNVKQYVFNRDKYLCQLCKKKSEKKLHVHHIQFRSNLGTNSPDNLTTLCVNCHDKLHKLKKDESEKLSKKLQKISQKKPKHATEVSILKSRLCKHFTKLKGIQEFEETFGYITKFNRERVNLIKDHHIDAICIASQENITKIQNQNKPFVLYLRRCVSKGDYQQTKGIRSDLKIPTGKLFGLKKFDLVKTSKGIGFVKGKRSSGFFAISDIHGNTISESVNIKKNLKRIQARRAVLMWGTQFLPAQRTGYPCEKIDDRS
jgi:5-methylcytosine-specific restriction endonuclease McrA